nr:MAG: ORF1 [TTV-like mini virus]UGV34512.1 MAG: ORF1 [TTV-like mini virus]
MPFWRYRYRRYPWRWGRRRYRRRYPRTTFRRTIWRRRHRVRKQRFKKKLKKLIVRQYQPQSIKKLTVSGLYQLFLTTIDRIEHNNTLYMDSTTPFHVPGGGGMSLSQFTLQNLFDQHLRMRNWWTKSNDSLPLIRYLGCTVYLYFQPDIDYIFAYNNCFPMKASRICYNATQPTAMLLMKNRKIVPSRYYGKRKKPYKKVFIKPPPQLENRWYFQHTLADVPLVNFMATAASLTRYYAPSNAITATVRFFTLNTLFFTQHNFKYETTYGYQPKQDRALFAAPQATDFTQIKFEDLIYLGNALEFGHGTQFKLVATTTQGQTRYENYFTHNEYWGNPFMAEYLHQETMLIQATVPLNQIKQTLQSKGWQFGTLIKDMNQQLAEVKTPLLLEVRYNPHKDKGVDNMAYFLHIDEHSTTTWEPEPNKPELIARDLPLWVLLWGLADWQKISGNITTIDTHGILVIKTKYFEPKEEKYYVPLSESFLTERSPYFPYAPGDSTLQRTASDARNWHPKLNMQQEVINILCRTGPGTVKLPKDTSAEAHVKYRFHFKLGGCPPPMEIIKNPQDQPIWSIPNNLTSEPSLQSPGTPFEYFLYHFDQRGDILTKTAIERLKKEFPAKEIIPSITGSSGLNIPAQKTQESDSEASSQEENQKALLQQLEYQQQQHQQLRERIRQLLLQL